MNIAHIESKAVSGDHQGVQLLVRRFAACCLIGVAAMSAAQAGPRDRESQSQRDNPRAERMQRQPDQRQEERQQRQYDNRAEEQRRNQQIQQEQQNAQNNAEAFRRSGRLTPDERRDLRRQINEAGADIYPARTRR